MKKSLVFFCLFLCATTAFSTTWTITSSGSAFTPATITITLGDDINFVLAEIHNAREVSQVSWDANNNTPLPGGFNIPYGGGLVPSAQLGIGTHYYVCDPHISIGMKGKIIVQSTTG